MLFTPFDIRGMHLRNRFVLPAMQRGWGYKYAPTDRLTDFYRKCVQGGTSLIITESVAVDHPSVTWQSSFVVMLTDETSAAWRELIRGVKEEGGAISIQLWHEGAIRREGEGGPYPNATTLSPSGLIQAGRPNGRAATIQELDEIRAAFVEGAVRAQDLGADAVEVHSAHGYFLDQFLWTETNLRDDKYGGDIADRANYAAEIVSDIRSRVGEDFVIGLRFSQWKEVDFQAKIVHTPEELGSMLRLLENAGVDLFHVSSRRFFEPEWAGSPMGIAGWTKSLTHAAVMTNGSVGVSAPLLNTFDAGEGPQDTSRESIEELERRMSRGEFDLVSVGRANIADPSWVKKAEAGEFDKIVQFKKEMLNEALSEWDADLIQEAHPTIKG